VTTYATLEFEPLVALVGRRLELQPHRHHGCVCTDRMPRAVGRCLSFRALADHLGVTDRSIARWKRSSRLSRWRAEQICERLGVHPTEVWGSDYYAAQAA